jgi:hypothetical protein
MVEERKIPASAENQNSFYGLLSVMSGAEIFRNIRITQFIKAKFVVKTNTNLLERIQSTDSKFVTTPAQHSTIIFRFCPKVQTFSV